MYTNTYPIKSLSPLFNSLFLSLHSPTRSCSPLSYIVQSQRAWRNDFAISQSTLLTTCTATSVAPFLPRTSSSSLSSSAATCSSESLQCTRECVSYVPFPLCLCRAKKKLQRDEFMFFLTGGVGLQNKLANPASGWLSDKSWDELCRMSNLAAFKGFKEDFQS